MDVLAQALSVAEQAESASSPSGRVALTFDLEEPGQRAAYVAAIAVLRVNGVDPETLLGTLGASPTRRLPDGPANEVPAGEGDDEPDDSTAEDEVAGEQNAQLRRGYATAIGELTDDEKRQKVVVRETFPRVVGLLRDGANVEAVAQIQYRRWVEEHLDSVRHN